MSQKILNKVNNDIFSYDGAAGIFKMSKFMPTEIHHATGGIGTSGYILTSTGTSGNGWTWSAPSGGGGATDINSLTDAGATTESIYMGFGSGISSTGNYNTFLGINSGNANTSGAVNTFLGFNSGGNNVSGQENTLIGANAGLNNSTGWYNTFIGSGSGYANTSGSENTLIGVNAGFGNTTGGYSTIIGVNSGFSNNADYNVFIGYHAGFSNTTGTVNTFIGSNCGKYNVIGGYNAFYGINSGHKTTASHNTFIGINCGYNNVSGYDNTFLGSHSGHWSTGSRNTFLGGASGWNNTANNNTFVGYSSGNSNTSGTNNTFIGIFTGQSNTDGYDNTYVGQNAGYSNFSGHQNTFVGNTAGYNNTSNFNTFVGVNSGVLNTIGDRNTFIGLQAGYDNVSASNNTYVGLNSGFHSTHSNNTFFGASAGFHNRAGTNNVAIGYSAQFKQDPGGELGVYNTSDNEIVIGASAIGNGSNTITLGNTNSVDGLYIPGLQTGATAGDVLTFDGTKIAFAAAATYSPSVAFKATSNVGGNFTFSSGHPLLSAQLTNVTGHKGSFNIGGGYNPSTGLFTAPSAGLYYFSGFCHWQTASFNAVYVRLLITTPATSTDFNNGLLTSQYGANEAFNANFAQQVSGVISLAENDVIGMYVYALDVTNAAITRSASYFTGYKLDTSPMGSYSAGANMSLVGTEFNIPQSVATTASPTFTNVTANEIDGGVTNVSIKLNDTTQGGRLRFNAGYAGLYFVMRNDEFSCYYNGVASGLYLNYNGAAVYYGNPPSQLSDDRVKFNETNITNGLEVIRKLSPEKYTKRLPTEKIGTEEAGFIAQEVMAIPELKFAVKHPDKELIEGDPNTRYYAVAYDSIFTYAVAGLKELDTIVQQQAVLIKSLEARLLALESK